MFLIVMLSFAIVSEVSAISVDDAEPGESGLNVENHSTDLKIPSERSVDVGHESVENDNDISHLNNNQTPFKDVYNKTNNHKTLYEQNQTFHENHGEKMKNLPNFELKHLKNPEIDSSYLLEKHISHLASEVTSKLIGLYNVSQAVNSKSHGIHNLNLNENFHENMR
ncbi:hypothetical protein [Methanobrevibacter sp.]|uniref:hypothetical protein n=1 Tax=Methanobrevibacter sp. TaxID=66852 RepID=UPI00388EF85B